MKTILYSPLSNLLFLLICLIYCYGFYLLVQSSIWIAFVLTLILPTIFLPLIQPVDNSNEIKRILLLETGFNLLCFFAVSQWISVEYIDKALVTFFILQASGFMLVQWKKRAYLSLCLSVFLALAIGFWIRGSGQTLLLNDGELLIFGKSVPWQLMIIYGAWLTQLLFVEYRHVLPKMTLVICHIASFSIAVSADDFFHARIITASHLLFLSLCFNFKLREWGGKDFVIAESFSGYVTAARVQCGLSIVLVCVAAISFSGLIIM